MNKMLISKMVPADQLPSQFKEDLAVTPKTMLRVTVEVASGRRKPRQSKEEFLAAIHKITDHLATLPVLDDRPLEEMLYDEHGLPK